MPVYSVTMALMIIVGFTAILVSPGVSDPDLSLLTTVRKAFPPWMLGLIGGAGALTAMGGLIAQRRGRNYDHSERQKWLDLLQSKQAPGFGSL